ncbi:hypothetical protein UNDYM_4881 [Undibacterium sp. YM2]|nr:hypothetical protein UNDYM_4881 [Undibacterium sp. YM2]
MPGTEATCFAPGICIESGFISTLFKKGGNMEVLKYAISGIRNFGTFASSCPESIAQR